MIQLGDIGDVVLTMPTIRALRENYPDVKIGVCVREKAKELIEDSPWVDEVIGVDTHRRKPTNEIRHQLEFFFSVWKNRFDWTIELRSADRGAFISLISGAAVRIGRAAPDKHYWRNHLYTHVVSPKPEKELCEYAVEHNLNIIAPFNIVPSDRTPMLHVASARQRQAIHLLQQAGASLTAPMVVIHPFSLWPFKEWRNDQWMALIDFIQKRFEATILITGSAEERPKVENILLHRPPNVINMAGLTSIGVLAAILKISRSFIGVDTGAMHMAAAVRTPTISIFGPSPSVMWAPRGGAHNVVTPKRPCVPCRDKGCNDTSRSLCLETLQFNDFQVKFQGIIDKILTGI